MEKNFRVLRLAELVATFALAQDNAFGQPLESQLRSCLLADAICTEAGFDETVRGTTYWLALLRYLGCTGHAHEISAVFGDDIAILAETLVFDAGDPADVFRAMVAFATAGRAPEEHEQIVAIAPGAGAHDWAVHNFATGCEVADMLVQRLDLGAGVRASLAFTYERWNGNGFPTGASGDQIPLAMRVVHLSHDMEAIARRSSPRKRSMPLASAATGPTIPTSPISSRTTAPPGSSGSPRWIRGMPCSNSNRNPTASSMERRSRRPSRWPPTSST